MNISVNNGRRGLITFGGVERLAHIVEGSGAIEVAFFGEVAEVRRFKAVALDGVPHAIVGAAQKGDVRGTVLLTVETIPAP